MTKIVIDNPVQSEFGMVPKSLWTMPISYKAKALAAYLLCHHEVVPTVQQIENDLAIGKDLRQAAMRELIAAGIAEWHYVRKNGVFLAKELIVSTRPMLHDIASPRAVKTGGRKIRQQEPENPAHTAGKSRDLNKEKKKRAANGQFQKAELAICDLSDLGKAQLEAGNDVSLGNGKQAKKNSPEWHMLRKQLDERRRQ